LSCPGRGSPSPPAPLPRGERGDDPALRSWGLWLCRYEPSTTQRRRGRSGSAVRLSACSAGTGGPLPRGEGAIRLGMQASACCAVHGPCAAPGVTCVTHVAGLICYLCCRFAQDSPLSPRGRGPGRGGEPGPTTTRHPIM